MTGPAAARHGLPRELVLATGNPGKLRELQAMLAPLGVQVRPQAAYAVPDTAESGITFVENALLKARNAARHTGLPAIADDSGIAVDALRGAPGVYSARYAGPGASDAANLDKLLADAAQLPDGARGCEFVCVIVYLRHAQDPVPEIATGIWRGVLARAPCGGNGFGYDPIFLVPGHGCTSAELAPELKNRLSHRGQALRALLARLTDLARDG